jgi:hypothetical protein
VVSGHEEVGLGGMELDGLDDAALGGGERTLGRSLAQGVDHDLEGRLQVVDHGCEVVSLCVPDHTLNDVVEGELDHLLASAVRRELPLQEHLLLLVACHLLLVKTLCFFYYLSCLLVNAVFVDTWLDH